MRSRSKSFSNNRSLNGSSNFDDFNQSNSDSELSFNENENEDEEENNEENDPSLAYGSSDWKREESEKLILSIREQLPVNDKRAYYHRLHKLDWSIINIPNRSVEECKTHLNLIMKKVRHVRLLRELLDDSLEVLDSLDNKKKSLSAYQLFCSDFKAKYSKDNQPGSKFFAEASKCYHALSKEDREKYENRARLSSNSKEKKIVKRKKLMKESKTPIFCFIKQQEEFGKTERNKLKTEYKLLSDEKKTEWVRIAVEKYGDDTVLTKLEKSLLSGKPKRALSAQALFMKDYCTRYKSGVNFKDLFKKYNDLSEEEKKFYTDKALEQKMEYNRKKAKYKLEIIENEIKTHSMTKNDNSQNLQDEPDTKPQPDKDTSLRFEDLTFNQIQASSTIIKKKSTVDKQTKSKTINDEKVSIKSDNNDSPVKKTKKKNVSESTECEVVGKQMKKEKTPTKITKLTEAKDANTSLEQESDHIAPKKRKRSRSSKSISMSEDSDFVTPSEKQIKKPMKLRLTEPEKPPSSPYKFYKAFEYNGKIKKARKVYNNLSLEDKKRIKRQHKEMVNEYMVAMKNYLSTLSKEEIVKFSEKQQNEISSDSD